MLCIRLLFMLIISIIFINKIKAGEKEGSNIILQDHLGQVVLNSGKKGGENIIVKENKCCHKKHDIKYILTPLYHSHKWGHYWDNHNWNQHDWKHGWEHLENGWDDWKK